MAAMGELFDSQEEAAAYQEVLQNEGIPAVLFEEDGKYECSVPLWATDIGTERVFHEGAIITDMLDGCEYTITGFQKDKSGNILRVICEDNESGLIAKFLPDDMRRRFSFSKSGFITNTVTSTVVSAIKDYFEFHGGWLIPVTIAVMGGFVGIAVFFSKNPEMAQKIHEPIYITQKSYDVIDEDKSVHSEYTSRIHSSETREILNRETKLTETLYILSIDDANGQACDFYVTTSLYKELKDAYTVEVTYDYMLDSENDTYTSIYTINGTEILPVEK